MQVHDDAFPKCLVAERKSSPGKKKTKNLFKKIAFNTAISASALPRGRQAGHAFILDTSGKLSHLPEREALA